MEPIAMYTTTRTIKPQSTISFMFFAQYERRISFACRLKFTDWRLTTRHSTARAHGKHNTSSQHEPINVSSLTGEIDTGRDAPEVVRLLH